MMEMVTTAIYKELFGLINEQEVYIFTFINEHGNNVSITNYGGIITSWKVFDKNEIRRNIVLGFDNPDAYTQQHSYIGAIAGRYANRIAHGSFQINDTIYQVSQNESPHHLHGGHTGFDKVIWNAAIVEGSLVLTYQAKDGEEGYPGNLNVSVTFSYNNEDALSIVYHAITDKATPVNLTSHSYFNLTGNASNSVLGHVLQINATHYLPVDNHGIPSGEILSVLDTEFDFTRSRSMGSVNGFKNYDHNYVLDRYDGMLRSAAILYEDTSGLQLEVFTTEPGMQLYTGIHLDGTLQNSTGEMIQPYSGLCLETQHFPDSPNRVHFPDTILRPGEIYDSTTVYKVSLAT